MIKLTVQQYANKCNTSVQQVYRQIKKGSLTTVKEKNITLVIVEDEAINQTNNNDKTSDTKTTEHILIKHLIKENKRLHKQINKLNKQVAKATQTKEALYEKVIGYQLEHKPKEDIELYDSPPKKKSKRNTNKSPKKNKKG